MIGSRHWGGILRATTSATLPFPVWGQCLHTLNLRLPSDQLGFIIQDAEDKVIIADADLVPLLAKVRTRLARSRRLSS